MAPGGDKCASQEEVWRKERKVWAVPMNVLTIKQVIWSNFIWKLQLVVNNVVVTKSIILFWTEHLTCLWQTKKLMSCYEGIFWSPYGEALVGE